MSMYCNLQSTNVQPLTASEAEGYTNHLKLVTLYNPPQPVLCSDYLLLQIDVCTDSDVLIKTSFLSTNSTLAYVLCNGPCKTFDDPSVLQQYTCSTSLPVCWMTTKIQAGINAIYALIQASSGIRDPTSGNCVANVSFGATI